MKSSMTAWIVNSTEFDDVAEQIEIPLDDDIGPNETLNDAVNEMESPKYNTEIAVDRLFAHDLGFGNVQHRFLDYFHRN